VKWFNSQKGYGFIQPAGVGKDISAVEHAGLISLNEGQQIVRNRGQPREILSGEPQAEMT
jgi:cold shock protein